jgi:cytochrome c-type biogenesis protein CcsB
VIKRLGFAGDHPQNNIRKFWRLDSLRRIMKFKTAWLLLFLAVNPVFAEEFNFKAISLVPIQEGGRVKPLDTFARESVRLITGYEAFEGRPAMELLWDWLSRPREWDTKDFILVENLDLRGLLGVPKDRKRVSPRLLRANESFMAFARASYDKQQKKMTLNAMEQESLALLERLERLDDLESGDSLKVIPIPDPQTQQWASLGDLQRTHYKDGKKMPDSTKEVLLTFAGLLQSYDNHDSPEFSRNSQYFSQILAKIGGKDYADLSKISLEVQYNSLKPFRLAWMIHLGALILMGLSFLLQLPKLFKPGFLVFIAGILISAYGFFLRCLVAGRPPVSNMYESLIWVTFGMTVFALIFELVFKNRQFAMAGSVLAVIGFVLADNVPTILNSSIQPLEPVLRSNFWLTIHVLTITLSYAAFLLSLGIGHLCLWTIWKHGGDKDLLQKQTQLLYRVVQVGVVLLAAGTILGGVWANYSWGRFWGWDPKETWALIALMGYVTILHGRLAGWLRDVGFTIGVVGAFLGVLMAWYGVNFILGVGLHSYGFSKGGLPYVIAFVVLEMVWILFVGFQSVKRSSP